AALAASETDLVATLPVGLARSLAPVLGLRVLAVAAPARRVALYWHARTHEDEALRFFRGLVIDVTRSGSPQRSWPAMELQAGRVGVGPALQPLSHRERIRSPARIAHCSRVPGGRGCRPARTALSSWPTRPRRAMDSTGGCHARSTWSGVAAVGR